MPRTGPDAPDATRRPDQGSDRQRGRKAIRICLARVRSTARASPNAGSSGVQRSEAPNSSQIRRGLRTFIISSSNLSKSRGCGCDMHTASNFFAQFTFEFPAWPDPGPIQAGSDHCRLVGASREPARRRGGGRGEAPISTPPARGSGRPPGSARHELMPSHSRGPHSTNPAAWPPSSGTSDPARRPHVSKSVFSISYSQLVAENRYTV